MRSDIFKLPLQSQQFASSLHSHPCTLTEKYLRKSDIFSKWPNLNKITVRDSIAFAGVDFRLSSCWCNDLISVGGAGCGDWKHAVSFSLSNRVDVTAIHTEIWRITRSNFSIAHKEQIHKTSREESKCSEVAILRIDSLSVVGMRRMLSPFDVLATETTLSSSLYLTCII
jgi:hypothetical protein